MKVIKKGKKQSSLIHQKIRNAGFVTTEGKSKRFKYNLSLRNIKYLNDKIIILKTICNKIIQKSRIWFDKVDFRAMKTKGLMWLSEAFIEGMIINYIFWALLEWKFNLITLLAWGMALKTLLSTYWRLRNNGSITTIPQN